MKISRERAAQKIKLIYVFNSKAGRKSERGKKKFRLTFGVVCTLKCMGLAGFLLSPLNRFLTRFPLSPGPV